MATAVKTKSNKVAKKKKQKKISALNVTLIILAVIILFVIIAVVGVYFYGKTKYEGKFLPNTYLNGENVSGKTLEQAQALFKNEELPESLVITRQDGTEVEIKLADFDYTDDADKQIADIYAGLNHKLWFTTLFDGKYYEFSAAPTYDSDKLKSLLQAADWGSAENQNAEIELTDNGYEIKDAVQGDEMNYDTLEAYVLTSVASGTFEVNAIDSDCYVAPEITAEDLQEDCDKLNKLFTLSITYDFDYTTETLTGSQLMDMVTINEDGTYTADYDKCMEYVEYLADKYDTYNTERKFHATIQGDITIPTSDDAKYGWWIWQDETCKALVEMIEKGENVDSVDPIYYTDGNYVYTGLESARSADDDIGNTYVEVDLTNQTFWYYKDGELLRECLIVSGQTTSEARTTLPGVYKVWSKATNYRMKDTNADGDSWDTTCNYWTRVAIVGIGLHDSTWRNGNFGGNIYKYNGSHGCINMSYDDAKYVYENIDYDTPVVMYY